MASFVAAFKTCPSCLQVHVAKGFRKDASHRSGLSQRCLVCSAAESREAYLARMAAEGRDPNGPPRPVRVKDPAPVSTKRCPSCRERKVLPLFYDDASKRDGKETVCRLCSSERRAARAAKAPRVPKPPSLEVIAARSAKAEARAARWAEQDRLNDELIERNRLAREQAAAIEEARRPSPEVMAERQARAARLLEQAAPDTAAVLAEARQREAAALSHVVP